MVEKHQITVQEDIDSNTEKMKNCVEMEIFIIKRRETNKSLKKSTKKDKKEKTKD